MSKRVLGGLAPLLFPFASYAAPSLMAGSYYSRSGNTREWSQNIDGPLGKVASGIAASASELSRADVQLALQQGQSVTELVVLDYSVPNKATLLQHLKPGVAVLELSADADGLAQLQAALFQYDALSAIHLVSHAKDGVVLLGNRSVDRSALETDSGFFAAVRHALAPDGDLLFYGCELAKSEVGETWLDIVANNTQADVAASNDLTGSALQGGDWVLEIERGDIETESPFSEKALRDYSDILAFTGVISFDTVVTVGSYGSSGDSVGRGSGADNAQFGGAGGYTLTMDGSSFNTFGGYGYGTSSENETSITLSFTGGESFTANSIGIWNLSGTSDTFVITGSAGGSVNQAISNGGYANINLSGLTAGATSITITAQDGQGWVYLNDFDVSGVAPAGDTTPPSFENSTPSVGSISVSGATVSADLDEDGTVYYVVVADNAGAPSAAQVKAGQDSGGSAALVSGNFTTTSTTGSEAFSSLSPNTAYDLYVVAQDDEGTPNLQASATKVDFTTNAPDSNGALTAAGGVTEPVGLDTTIDTLGEAVDVFDFTLSDGGSGDGLAMSISQMVLNVTGSSTDTERAQITWRLNGPDVSNVTGIYNSGSDTITFSGLSVSIADGGSETYTVNAYYNDNTNITEDLTVILSVDGDTDVTTSGSGTQMGVTSAVTNGTGTTLDVVATTLAFTTQPAGSTSGSALSTQPVVRARDAFGNTDVDFTEVISLTEASPGSLSGNVASAVSGVAAFSSLTYTATADQQSFTLTANDQDGVGTNLPSVDSNSVTSDVVASKLLFTSQPSPLSVNNSQATALSTVPVVAAVDANNTVDTGYSTDITLAEVNGAGSATITGTGDTDGSGATVSITPSSGVSTFTGMSITYTASGASNETFNLQASSGGLSTANSSQFTAVVDSTPPSGYSVSFDQAYANISNANALTYTITGAEVGASYNYSITNAPGSVSSSGTITSATEQLSINSASQFLNDGTLTLSVYLTDTNGNVGSTVTDTLTKDTVAPTVSSVSVPASGSYNTGQNLDFTVNLSENVTVNTSGGTPSLAVTIGSTAVAASYLSGSGTSALMFRYTVQSGDNDSNGVALGSAINTNGGTLQDAAGNALVTALASIGNTTTVLVDTTGPTLSSSSPSDGATNVQYNDTVTLQFNEAVSAGSGNITLYNAADDSVFEAFDVASASFSGAAVSVTPSTSLSPTNSYYLQVDSSAIEDAAGNTFAGISDTTTLNFTVANNAPVGVADSASTNEDNAVAVDVLANDSDVDSSINSASVTVTNAPSNGSTSVNTGTGVITYTPNADFNGSDNFTYTVSDLLGGTSSDTTVTITVNAVNDAPVASGDVANTPEDTPINIDVAANDSDVDTGDSVDTTSLVVVAAPSNGSAVVNAGQIQYTPSANYSGSDSFTYTIDDQNGATSNVATVMVNVSGVNDAPVAANDSSTTDEDTAVNIDLVSNDSDVDGSVDATTVTVMTNPASGSVSINPVTGVATYTPNANSNGSDSFTYVVQDDGNATSNTATVTITVNSINDAPAASDDVATVQEDSPYNINVLGNDSDVDGTLQTNTLELVTNPGNGTAVVSGGQITYTPGAEYSGADSLTYRVQDDLGEWSNTATVSITVQAVNDDPLANNDSATTDEDNAVVISVIDNDSDVDGTLDLTSVTVVATPASGTAISNGDGTITYTPNADSNGSDSFTYSIQDDAAATSNIATVSVTVNAVNDAPTITGSPTLSLLEGEAYSFIPTLADVDDVSLTAEVVNLPIWASFDSSTGALTGTPLVGDAGDYANISLSVTDGSETATLALFTITVIGDNDTDGTADSIDPDDDNDGMSDEYEAIYGFNPLDASDGAEDADGDTISNYQESVDNTDPSDASDYVDVTAPVIVPPSTLTINATGLFTPVSVVQLLGLLSDPVDDAALQAELDALTADNVDGSNCCDTQVENLLDGNLLLPPGNSTVTYSAIDRKGNVGTATQTVEVIPLVSMSKDQTNAEGGSAAFRILLNGKSPSYPLTVSYLINSGLSTADGSDHDLVDGSVTFTTDQTSAQVTVQLLVDGNVEGDETLVVDLDGSGINVGAKSRYTLTIAEDNLPPEVSLQVTQGAGNTVQVLQSGGDVTVAATVTDPNSGDTAMLDWSATDAALTDNDGDTTNSTFVLDPAALNPGVYRVQLSVTDGNGAIDTARTTFQVVAALPALSNLDDSDGDGVDDQTEGAGDEDDDGIPDYLDNLTARNLLPEVASETAKFLMECDPGVRCRLGEFALQNSSGGTSLDDAELDSIPGLSSDGDYQFSGGVFDFEVHELPAPGDSVRIVVPQTAAIPANAVYRKYVNGQWRNFSENAFNQLHSASGSLGYCPPPGDSAWTPGLVEGYYCVQLTIQDGGPNDADGVVNGSIEDPGGVASLLSTIDVVQNYPDIRSSGKGSSGGSVDLWWLLLVAGLMARRRLPRVRNVEEWRAKAAGLALLLGTGLAVLPAPAAQAMDFDFKPENTYVAFQLYQARGSQGKQDFVRDMVGDAVDVTLHSYDVSRTAYQLSVGYQYHPQMAVEFGYLDLGDVSVDIAAVGTPRNLQSALEDNYPVTGEGWTLANRFFWPLQDKLNLSAELGLFWWDGEVNLTGADVNPDLDGGVDPLLGLGVHYLLNPKFGLGGQIKRVWLDGQTVDLLGVDIAYHF
ncbi:MAG: hypothetical protein CMK89_10140 [Pseudomonadales bacterium]|nr:hypothetical protein [Pseudomonadales bacterium]